MLCQCVQVCLRNLHIGIQAKLELARQTEESKLHQERLQQLEVQYTEQFKRQDRALKDIAAAMHQEEQAKLAAEKGLQSAKERADTFEDDIKALTRKLEDAHNRCREAEIDRDEFQVRSSSQPPRLKLST